jgi:Recombination endonuclease VII
MNEINRESYARRPQAKEQKRLARREQDKQNYYGMSAAEYDLLYDRLFEQQNGLCRICGTDNPRNQWGRFAMDHDHRTKEVRGLLCHPCNRALGMFKDDVGLLACAIDYLQSSRPAVVPEEA